MAFSSNAEYVPLTSQDNDAEALDMPYFRHPKHRNRWGRIDDLDDYFRRVYHFWQVKGFPCYLLQQVLELLHVLCFIFLTIFVLTGINYKAIVELSPQRLRVEDFAEKFFPGFRNMSNGSLPHVEGNHYINVDSNQLDLWDVFSFHDFLSGRSNALIYIYAFCALALAVHRSVRTVHGAFSMWRIRQFYRDVLELDPGEMDNYTWPQVLKQLLKAQAEHHISVQSSKLTELDVHHRILRFKNFVVALVNKNVLPVDFQVPLMGRRIYFTEQLKYSYELILFWASSSPFMDSSNLQKNFHSASPEILANGMRRTIAWYAVISLLFCPLIFMWQLFYTTFMFVEMLQQKGREFGLRIWSPYARQRLRLFNELDHQFNLRLGKAYTPSNKYINSFISPIIVVLASNLKIFAAAILALIAFFTFVDEKFLVAENVPLTITVLGVIIAVCHALTPGQGDAADPEDLLNDVVVNTVAGPKPDWLGNAHTLEVRREFGWLFPYRMTFWIEQLISPIATPYILFFHLRPRSLEIIKFFRHFTVRVQGVGDVCSFAQMDVHHHGNPKYSQSKKHQHSSHTGENGGAKGDDGGDFGNDHSSGDGTFSQSLDDGKVEHSLINFSMRNPGWAPPSSSANFMKSLKESAGEDALRMSGSLGSMTSSMRAPFPDSSMMPHTGNEHAMSQSIPPSSFSPRSPPMASSIYPTLGNPSAAACPGNAVHAFQSLTLATSMRQEEPEQDAQTGVQSAWSPPVADQALSRHARTQDNKLATGVGHAAVYLQGHVSRRLLEQQQRDRRGFFGQLDSARRAQPLDQIRMQDLSEERPVQDQGHEQQ